jgi:hypothetical protein
MRWHAHSGLTSLIGLNEEETNDSPVRPMPERIVCLQKSMSESHVLIFLLGIVHVSH